MVRLAPNQASGHSELHHKDTKGTRAGSFTVLLCALCVSVVVPSLPSLPLLVSWW